ncbi:hypothetical protein DFH06DRAFT_1464235 [Mycena polygramma]|nr:hypothetical protein DFH06DRAFT_1464235 [Mycena polygramma]
MSASSILEPNSALPPNTFQPSQNSYPAYETVLRAEEQAVKTENLDNIRNARIVGYTILNAPDNQGIVREALESDTPGSIYLLGEKYLHYFIKPFKKKPGSPIPQPSEILTPLYSQSRSEIQMRTEETRPSTDLKTTKRHGLLRDQFKCMLTGMYDKEEAKKSLELRMKGKAEGAKALSTSCCHIFPASIDTFKPSQAMHSATIWQILKTVGGLDPGLVASLNGLLDLDYLPKIITFTTSTRFPLPRADLLTVHAAACRVAYLSGAAEYLDMMEWENEDEEQVPFIQLSEADFTSRLATKLQRIPLC